MRLSWAQRILGLVGLTMVLLAMPSPLTAHTTTTYYGNRRWNTNNVVWYIGYQSFKFNTTDMTYGDDQWNANTGASLYFTYGGRPSTVGWTGTVCGMPAGNWVITTSTIPSLIGYTQVYDCVSDSENDWTKFVIRLNQDVTWYSGSGTPPAGAYDVRGVLTHEFGHATGFTGHFPDLDAACASPPNTMCNGGATGSAGVAYRTTETHDEHTFAAYY